MATKKAKRTAKKVNKTINNVDFSESFHKIKNTAFSINNQVLETVGEVVDDIMVKGEQLKDVATTKVKEVIENIDVNAGVKKVKKTAAAVNEYTLETAEEIVEGVVKNGEQWQGIAEKAVNGGLKLAAKQQDIMFSTLETVKEQLVESGSRFRDLLKK
ncbi:MAG TPA: hypothetical protein ENK52_00870 [Saprospiraceae bacterium]|nr:hypothetical protein [Saprospiraceae bacterium]